MSVTDDLTAKNASRWSVAKVKPSQASAFASVAKRLVASKDRYEGIEAATGVPWFIVAVIHEREASQRWDRSIAQGDPWSRVSTHVPQGRGPFTSWETAALDALRNCAPFAAKWQDWSAGGALTLLEHYNGLGYANKGRPSPYVWSGTDQYAKGKYVSDGKYDPNAVDKQLGCAGLILAMGAIDSSVTFSDVVASDSQAVTPEEMPVDQPAPVGDIQVSPRPVPVPTTAPPPDIGTAVKAARAVGLGTAGVGALTQVVSSITGPVNDTVQVVQQTLDTSGHVVDATKKVISVAPTGFWGNSLAFVQSPKFLAVALVVICVAWGLTYYLRLHKKEQS